MQNGESDGAVHLVLAGDDHGIEQSTLSSIIQCICQGDCRAQVNRLHCKVHALNATTHQLSIVSEKEDRRKSRVMPDNKYVVETVADDFQNNSG